MWVNQNIHNISAHKLRVPNPAFEMDWAGQAAFRNAYLTDGFYLYHSFSVIVAQPLSFTFCIKKNEYEIENYRIPLLENKKQE